jgi:hypothetical protein
MNVIIGFMQLAFALALGTVTYTVEPKGGWFLHVAFAFLYSYWITVVVVKLASIPTKEGRGSSSRLLSFLVYI